MVMSEKTEELNIDALEKVSGGNTNDMRLEMTMDRKSKFVEALSNIMKKMSDLGDRMNSNLKG
jgi:hypothetical protein